MLLPVLLNPVPCINLVFSVCLPPNKKMKLSSWNLVFPLIKQVERIFSGEVFKLNFSSQKVSLLSAALQFAVLEFCSCGKL